VFAKGMIAVVAITTAMAYPAQATSPTGLTTLYSFKGNPDDGLNPDAPLLYHKGLLFGTTSAGGDNDEGIVFSVDPKTGQETILYQLSSSVGATPTVALISYSGELYGAAQTGGNGFGSVFEIDPTSGQETSVYLFDEAPDGMFPDSALLPINGEFYGATQSGGSSLRDGTIYTLNASTGAESIVYSFKGGTDGVDPGSSLIYLGNNIYGTTQTGGKENLGTVFAVNIENGTESVLHSFKGGADGEYPDDGVIATGKALYGTTYRGGASDLGTVFSNSQKTGHETVVHSFVGGSDGANPSAKLIYVRGLLYGTTYNGGSGYGTLFSIDLKTGTATVLYSFTGGSDGANPQAGLIYKAASSMEQLRKVAWGPVPCSNSSRERAR
jgi:uncharacterized repeat protein (TIGR03803 family)